MLNYTSIDCFRLGVSACEGFYLSRYFGRGYCCNGFEESIAVGAKKNLVKLHIVQRKKFGAKFK